MQLDELYRLVVENAHDGIFHSDAQGRIVWVNRLMASMLGYSNPADLIGLPARDLYVTPRVRDRLQRQVEEHGRVTEFVAHLKRADGGRLIIEANVALVRDAEGRPQGVVGVARDITRRLADEERLQQEHELNELVMNTIPAVVLFVHTDGTIRWANAAAFRLARCRPSELVGSNVFGETAPGWLRGQAEAIREVLRTGRVVTARHQPVILEPRRQIYLNVTVAPIRQMGEIAGAVIEAVDVSETVQLYEQMLAAERKFRAMFDQAPELYFSIDSQGLIIDCNDTACQALGLARADLVGRPITDVYDKRSHARVRQWLAAGKVEDVRRPRKLRLLRRDGKPLPVAMVWSLVRDEAGQVISAFAVHRPLAESRPAGDRRPRQGRAR